LIDLSLNVDAGEREAISLAREIQADAVLMDDYAGRRAAAQLELPVVGTLGLLEQAVIRGWINLPLTLERLRQTNARIDPIVDRGRSRTVPGPFRPDLSEPHRDVCYATGYRYTRITGLPRQIAESITMRS
jgi:hypothetical protein